MGQNYIDYAGDVSAAALGFIHGNVKGAFAAQKLYRKYLNYIRSSTDLTVMAPIKRRHPEWKTPTKQRPKLTISPPTTGRRGSTASSASRRTSLSIASSRRSSVSSKRSRSNRALESRGSNVALSRRKRTIKMMHKNPKKVRVSRSLRKKINKVIGEKDPTGFYQMTQTGYIVQANTNGQTVGTICPTVLTDGTSGELFSPTQVMDAAGILWNAKAPGLTPAINDNQNFNKQEAKVHVKKQWFTVKFRNNTMRDYTLNLYACQRKDSDIAGALAALGEWTTNLQEEIVTGANVTSVTPNTLYASPFLNKSMNDKFKMELTKVVLQPGEEYVYSLEGPSMTYDYRKFYQGSTYYGANKKTNVSLFYTCYMNLIGNDGTPFVGRMSNDDHTSGYSLLYEVNYYYKLEMPEQAGVSWSVAGSRPRTVGQPLPADATTTYLGNRRDAYAFYNGSATPAGANKSINREQPLTVQAPL